MQYECRALSFSSKELYKQQTGDKVCYAKGELALVNIQGVSGGIVNILGGGSMDYSK
jgi:hypothetical protein